MKIFNLDKDTYLIYKDDKTTEEVVKPVLEAEIEAKNNLPVPDDKELLSWARVHHPTMALNKQISADLDVKQSLLEAINNGNKIR